MRMEKTRTTRKITEWTPYLTRPVGRPRLRWMDQVEEDLKRMKIIGWRVKAGKDRSGVKLLNRPRPIQGCRVNRRRKDYDFRVLLSLISQFMPLLHKPVSNFNYSVFYCSFPHFNILCYFSSPSYTMRRVVLNGAYTTFNSQFSNPISVNF
jgi:hypothetical protein